MIEMTGKQIKDFTIQKEKNRANGREVIIIFKIPRSDIIKMAT